MKKILGLDLGTNSIGWALLEQNFDKHEGRINGIGSRIIPMSQEILGKFDSGVSISQTAERTGYRGTRRLYQRDNLRRERLHRVLNILGFLPKHYADAIDFKRYLGQFQEGTEVKLNYRKNEQGKHEFIFIDSFNEMVQEFENAGKNIKIPYDWTLYYLRKKALTQKISKEELAWIILNFNQKRGYYQLRGEENKKEEKGKLIETFDEEVKRVEKISENIYEITLSDETVYQEKSNFQITFVGDIREVEITTEDRFDKKTKESSIIKTKKVLFLKTLKVTNVINTGEKDSNDLVSYKVILENGNEFIKKKKTEINWEDKLKTVLFTYTVGNKTTLRISAPEETSWTLIKKKAEQDLDIFNKQNKTLGVGQYIYEIVLQNPNQKIRGGLVKTIERKYYKKELEAILKEQIKHHPEIDVDKEQGKELYKVCIDELYPRNEAHQSNIKDKGFNYLFVDDIIFYQRPLKSKKSTISNCSYESRVFYKNVEVEENGNKVEKIVKIIEPLKGISKSHPLYQEFRLWQFLKNLKIHKKEDKVNDKTELNVDVTNKFLQSEDDWVSLYDFLNERKEIEQKQFIQYFVTKKLISKTEKDNYRWNYVEDKKYPCNDTRAQFISRLKKVEGIKNSIDFLIKITKLGNSDKSPKLSREI